MLKLFCLNLFFFFQQMKTINKINGILNEDNNTNKNLYN